MPSPTAATSATGTTGSSTIGCEKSTPGTARPTPTSCDPTPDPEAIMGDPVRFHLSLNVTDLNRSVRFFRTLFGQEPAKVRPDYAKFEPAEPPLVLSLGPAGAVARGGALNHLGFRLPDAKSLVAM